MLIRAINAERYYTDEHARACYHEAGHAVIARALGFRCGHVWASANGEGRSMTFDARFNAPTPAERLARVVVSAAGPESEILFCGSTRGHEGDLIRAHDWLRRIGQDEADRAEMLETARARARGLVRLHAPKIARVGWRLLSAGRLSSEAVDALVSRA